MKFIRLLKSQFRLTANPLKKIEGGSPGIALAMVLATMAILTILVTDFTYLAQFNQRMSYETADQIKAHYLAKSALKLSMLRLKIYDSVKKVTKGDQFVKVPTSVINQIWSIPLIFPFPTEGMGLTQTAKDSINKFHKESQLDGEFTAIIESESARFNLNSVLPGFSGSSSQTTSGKSQSDQSQTSEQQASDNDGETQDSSGASSGQYNPDRARKGLFEFMAEILNQKYEADPDFADRHRDLRLEDLVNEIIAWADWRFEAGYAYQDHPFPPKRAPFYDLSELHMVPGMTDDLFDLFAPSFTASTTSGININTLEKEALRALIPKMTEEEVVEFYLRKDPSQSDGRFTEDDKIEFKNSDEFYAYLKQNVSAYYENDEAVAELKKDFTEKGIRLVTEESQFKILVQAKVNQATRVIEAYLNLEEQSKNGDSSTSGTSTPSGSPTGIIGPGGAAQTKPNSGIQVTFMRFL